MPIPEWISSPDGLYSRAGVLRQSRRTIIGKFVKDSLLLRLEFCLFIARGSANGGSAYGTDKFTTPIAIPCNPSVPLLKGTRGRIPQTYRFSRSKQMTQFSKVSTKPGT